MLRRPERIFLSPAFSIFVALIGAAGMLLFGWREAWIATPLSALLAVALAIEVRARVLFKGPNLPILGIFMMLQACDWPSLPGMGLCAVALISLISLWFCYLKPKNTRTIFTLFLMAGVPAVYYPQWLLWAVVLLFMVMTVRAFSLRGLVAALLGLLTPFLIEPGLLCLIEQSPEPFWRMVAEYQLPLFALPTSPDWSYIFSCAVCIIAGLSAFLTAYGYPGKQRSRNLAVYVLSLGMILMPLICNARTDFWLPTINLCAAYHVAHVGASKRFGWLFVLMTIVLIITFCIAEICIF